MEIAELCMNRTLVTYDALVDRIPDTMREVERPIGEMSFKIPLQERNNICLSVGYQFDANRLLQTALYDSSGILYIPEWGYDCLLYGFGTGDPNDSSTIDALINEIDRLNSSSPGYPSRRFYSYLFSSEEEESESEEESEEEEEEIPPRYDSLQITEPPPDYYQLSERLFRL